MEARPNFAKTKRGASGGFLPRPLLLRLRHPNSEKRNQPKFCGILSPENCFRKTSSALFQISSSGLLSKKVRILYNEYRQKGFCKCELPASLRSAANLYGIFGEKETDLSNKIWFEPICFRNAVISDLSPLRTNSAA